MSSKAPKNSVNKVSDFGRRLKEAFSNASNQSIAEKLGVTKSALTAYMQGRIPPADKLIEIAKLTECNLNWLLTGELSKKLVDEIKKPQGIILQGSKGGVGNTTSATLIASVLALKGYGVLLVDDLLGSSNFLFHSMRKSAPQRKKQENRVPADFLLDKASRFRIPESATRGNPRKNTENNYYISTKNKNLDLFIPKGWKYFDFPEDKFQPFTFDYLEMSKRYQFVIFDIQKYENAFYYPHNYLIENFPLEPILRNAKVLVPFDPLQSYIDAVEATVTFVEREKRIYPKADFLGIFLIGEIRSTKFHKNKYKEQMEDLENLFGDKILRTRINYHSSLNLFHDDIQKLIFSRKTNIYSNFSELVDEILEKLNIQPSK